MESFKKGGEAGLDLSKAKVALYNRAGIRKYEAECAPNGYFFIPVYETGGTNALNQRKVISSAFMCRWVIAF